MTTPARGAPRDLILERLALDLIGPGANEEALASRPSDVYLTGILWPQNTPVLPEEDEHLAVAPDGEDPSDDGGDPAQPAAVPMRRPSTAGVSFAVRPGAAGPVVNVAFRFGLYSPRMVRGAPAAGSDVRFRENGPSPSKREPRTNRLWRLGLRACG